MVLNTIGLLNKTYSKRLHNGYLLKVRPSEHIQQHIFWYGYYEKETILTLEEFLTSDSIMLDIGANIGYYSIVASAKAKKVIAFEPSSRVRSHLEENIQLNGIKNIEVHAFAAGSEKKTARFYTSFYDNTGMSGLREPENFSGQTEEVEVVKLDDWLASGTSIDIVKIDVEGAEWDVLSGMERTIANDQPIIFIEVIDDLLSKFGRNKKDIYDFLWSRGYKAYEIPLPKTLRPVNGPMQAYSILFLPVTTQIPSAIKLIS